MLVGRLRPDHPALPSCITSFTCFLDHKDSVVVDHAIESLASLTEMLTRGGTDLTVLDADGLIAKLLGLLRVATVDPQEADPDMSQRASSVMTRHAFAQVSTTILPSHTPQKWSFLPSARLAFFFWAMLFEHMLSVADTPHHCRSSICWFLCVGAALNCAQSSWPRTCCPRWRASWNGVPKEGRAGQRTRRVAASCALSTSSSPSSSRGSKPRILATLGATPTTFSV
jgi:hypothetical protein